MPFYEWSESMSIGVRLLSATGFDGWLRPMRFMAAALILGLVYPATAQVPPGVPITGPKGDTRPGPDSLASQS